MSLLAIEDLEAGYGEIIALARGQRLTVEPGEVVTIIGSNGAGKTTLLRTISGLVKARSGRICLRRARHRLRRPAQNRARGPRAGRRKGA